MISETNWEFKKLKEVTWFQEGPGVRNSQYTLSGVKLLNVANLRQGKIDLTSSKRYIAKEEAYGKYKHFLCDEGDLILASSGIQVDYIDKKLGFVTKEMLPLCMNTSTIRFKPNPKILTHKFLYYFFKSYLFKNQIIRLITGSAQLNFGPSHLQKIKILIPPIETQHQIVAELDTISEIIETRKLQLQELDKLAHATFYNMFGDPVTNEKGWEVKPIKKIVKIGTGGTPSRRRESEYYNGTINWAKTTEVNGSYIYHTEEKITHLALEESNCKIYPANTILLAMYGQGKTRGNVGLLKIDAATNQACAAIPPTKSINQVFLFELLKQSYHFIRSLARGGNQENLNLSLVGNINIIYPPIEFQNKFVIRINNINSQKTLIQKSIFESQQLFDYTLDKYFS